MPGWHVDPPELARYSARGDAPIEKWPGQPVTTEKIMQATGDPRDWYRLATASKLLKGSRALARRRRIARQHLVRSPALRILVPHPLEPVALAGFQAVLDSWRYIQGVSGRWPSPLLRLILELLRPERRASIAPVQPI